MNARQAFLKTDVSKYLVLSTMIMAIIYFIVITFFFPHGNPILFWALVAGEVFHLWQAVSYLYTVWDTSYLHPSDPSFLPKVDVYITVAGEPVEIVEETARAALAMEYPSFSVFLLNDGRVASKDNWQDIEDLASRLGIDCITRIVPGGAKAGNINNALAQTAAPFITVFDADHVPHPDFLIKMMGHFADTKIGFVQSPQYYKNYDENPVTLAAWEQQTLFFGPICKGKNRLHAQFMCGTNMVIRREALDQVGGMCTTNIAEDFVTSLFIHEKGWDSAYVPEVLAEGLAPEDFLTYYKQQFRWARGSLEVTLRYNPLFRRGLRFSQRIQYLASASYYLSGVVVLINILFPLVFFVTGQVPLQISTMTLAAAFLPYIFLNLYVLQLSSNFSYTFRALSFSLSSFALQNQALIATILNKKTAFAISSKTKLQGNFLGMVTTQILYCLACITGFAYAIYREGVTASVVTNASWAVLYIAVFFPFIRAATPSFSSKSSPQTYEA